MCKQLKQDLKVGRIKTVCSRIEEKHQYPISVEVMQYKGSLIKASEEQK